MQGLAIDQPALQGEDAPAEQRVLGRMDAGIQTWNLGQVRTGLGVSSDFALFSLGRGATMVPVSLNPRETVHHSRPLFLKRGESRDSLHRTGRFGAQRTLSHQAARGSKLASGGSVTQGW